MEILRKPYELSLWEDILTFVYEDGYESERQIIEGHGAVKAQYYKERKLCIIGSNTMNTPIRAMQGKIVRNINGQITLTFNMFSHYWDEESESLVKNPFVDKLVNERKIKLRYGVDKNGKPKWYDLIIKNISQNSENKTYTYTAKSLFVNELSKSGFNLEFGSELENNMGNIEYLAEKVLDGSDWQVEKMPVLEQTLDEPLFRIVLSKSLIAHNMRDTDEELTIPYDENNPPVIYAFYENIVNENPYLQFLYRADGIYETDEDLVITNSENWYIDGTNYIGESGEKKPDFAHVMEISDSYRGSRLVRKARTAYDAVLDKYVTVYTDGDGNEVYGITETEYVSPASTKLCITNPYGFTSLTGWQGGQMEQDTQVEATEERIKILDLVSVPDLRDVKEYTEDQEFTSYLKFGQASNNVLYNSGIIDNRSKIGGFVQGEKYVFRARYGVMNESNGLTGSEMRATSIKLPDDENLKFYVSRYELSDGVFHLQDNYFQGEVNKNLGYNKDTGYFEIIVECQNSLKYSEMILMAENLGFFVASDSEQSIYIESIEFFPYVEIQDGEKTRPLYPDELREGEVKTLYSYYYNNGDYKDYDSVNFLYRDYTPSTQFEASYSKDYEKVRSITASESNRFNLLQELCETFECWIEFNIEHEENGAIALDENYRQKKTVSFKEYIDNINYAGFKYGVNLKSIQRTIDSDSIVTKLIVKDNSNEFATDGFCSISRSGENPSGENFLLDFDYYIQHRMLDRAQLTNDLYSKFNESIGYYVELRKLNNLRDVYIKEQSGLLTDIANLKAAYQTYELTVAESERELLDKKQDLYLTTGYDFETLMNNKPPENQQPINPDEEAPIWVWWNSGNVLDIMTAIAKLKSNIAKYSTLKVTTKENLDNAEERFDLLTRILASREESETEERILIKKDLINKKFYQKYSRFLQEGSWISEDYMDDDLYCIDAKSTLHTSGKPKLTYSINVLELSQLEGYENFVFDLGDKTTIEDIEFFGWSIKNGVLTPRKEEIIVTELASMLDSPEQDQIRVQNYKSKFEDLFQRMAATTQAVEYKTGLYDKTTGIIETDGTISPSTLQSSMANNALTLSNAQDQSVVWDETGIAITSPLNPTEIVRIVNKGIYLSQDGGLTWSTGITGRGINATYLNAGIIDVEKIRIMKGSFPSFRWDSDGISAYQFKQESGLPTNFNYGKFVRLDQYGLYGIDGQEEFSPTKESDIWEKAKFALTWKGFMLKNRYGNGYVSIDSEQDFVVVDEAGKTRIKIGNIGGDSAPVYGIRVANAQGAPVMETDDSGELWLKNRLIVGNNNTSTVEIGYLAGVRNGTNKHEVIHAGEGSQSFIVYEDGKMVATGAEFTGIINATGGQIGGVDIAEIDLGYQVLITSDSGQAFIEEGEKRLTAQLYKGDRLITENVEYQWYKNGVKLIGETSNTLIVTLQENYQDGDGKDYLNAEAATYSCEAKVVNKE